MSTPNPLRGAPVFGPRAHPDPLCRVVLVEPLIPENTGNISRTCVATESELHLIEPMGFELNESRVKRAGLDYWQHLAWRQHANYNEWLQTVPDPSRTFFVETGGAQTIYESSFQPGDWLIFGKETSGLSREILDANAARTVTIPMPGSVRSLNLSNAVAIVVFELLRQCQKSWPTRSS